MRHNIYDWKLLVEHQFRRCLLDVHGGAIAAQDFFFVNPHSGCRKFDLGDRIVRGKQTARQVDIGRAETLIRGLIMSGIGGAAVAVRPQVQAIG